MFNASKTYSVRMGNAAYKSLNILVILGMFIQSFALTKPVQARALGSEVQGGVELFTQPESIQKAVTFRKYSIKNNPEWQIKILIHR